MRSHVNGRFIANFVVAAVSAASMGAQLYSQELNTSELRRVDHKTMINADALRGLNTSGTAGNGIFYYGGPVMLGTPNVYLIWYGNWAPSSKLILSNLASSLGGSPYFGINSTYYDGANNFITGNAALAGQTTDNYSQGTNLSDSQIQTIVSNAIIPSGSLPLDPQGVYFVMTWTDVTATSGFCSQYCGWHTAATIKGQTIKYSFVGNAAVKCPNGCIAQSVSPNNDPGADGAASVLAHEFEEAVTDPNLNAWYDTSGNENADKCAWTFGTMYTTGNGSKANVKLGGLDYLIQQNWVNAAGGFCAMSYNNTAPVLTSSTPNSGAQGSTVNVTLAGSNFIAGATVGVSGTGVTASSVTVVSSTQITATLTLAAAAATGAHNLSVTTANGTSGLVAFNVTGTSPTLSSVAPNSGSQGTAVNVTLTGTNFTAGSTVGVSGSGVTAGNLAFVSATQITATLTIGAAAPAGSYNLSVTTPGGTSNTVPFTVNTSSLVPVLSSIAPNTGVQGSSVNVTLTGSNFTPQTTLRLGGNASQSNVVVVSSTQMTATFILPAASSIGAHNVYVVNAAGSSNILVFNVTAGATVPTVTSVSPNSGVAGNSVNVTFTGTNFIAGATVGVSGSGVSASNVSVVSATQITATLVIGAATAPGTYNLSVTTTNGTSNTVPFTVSTAAPTLTALTPNSGTQGSAVNVTLTGTNFVSGASISIVGSGVAASNVTLVSATQITATFTVAAGATPGADNVTVSTTGGTSNAVGFTVNAGSTPPTLSSVSPNSGMPGSAVNVTFTGSNFVAGTTVGVSGSGVTASGVTVVSATQITATLTIATGTAAGSYNVSVTSTGGTSNTVPFTVNASTQVPVLTSMTPNSGNAGSVLSVVLTGSNFTPGTTLRLSGPASQSNVVVVSPTQMTFTITLPATATPGVRNVSVINSAGTSNILPFTAN